MAMAKPKVVTATVQQAGMSHTHNSAYTLGDKVRNRHIDQVGVVDTVAVNAAGAWYYVTTQSGMSIGWWHETDIAGAPRTLPPGEKREEG